MKPMIADMTNDDRRWQAVCERDASADGQFVFAVLTTGVCCRPSCRSRRALRENVCFYADVEAAKAAGYRPCKRCRPDNLDPDQQRVEKVAAACRLLEQEAPITLEALAQQLAVSPFHFHRIFKSVTGLTPKAWQQAWRARRLREALSHGQNVTSAALAAGFPDSASYYRQANETLGMTARQFKRGGEDILISWVCCNSASGRCLVAFSERGVCAVLLGDDDKALYAQLASLFPGAQLQPGDDTFTERVAQVVAHLDNPQQAVNLPLDIRGTAFQQRVWQALRQIPAGETRSYREVAHSIGQPRAVRSVAGACAANKLAIVIPCHRVVREGGALSGYRWGSERKALLLAREAKMREK
ncbi:TPA: bifunctional DNA-binding transcriptional regulator/O6-methylguanine-DNA methyltransferase Ada [Klebsiella aerogenes]|uniref:bifunctional DNA-binding transcriptional regulator/O6-methylguanine-DNA methyltransferase Ada n=1 Tax=Klebsiella aerogenes TaxID=548 RepID=UPI00063BFC0E|nr:bifunctional DNA-binding transcriptional regulator/O6-methylguanine-DNA methyltransferase Ada [Klebsiella aerogenes]KLE54227.1 6-O-methylguanine DNA methyltransferase [Klebsiella aerogenes]HDT0386637.1 bifunctional DNA-binding transcriptional regulator/O6-methylguanine-DNA methyltransferase Ada [Klebsiella aerogenes]HEO9731949.1 bifunctional DNA-binding transcriptional regulator/O6-methylguanine-DNA methyltransferase Ada [Klebsiella aerogenes]